MSRRAHANNQQGCLRNEAAAADPDPAADSADVNVCLVAQLDIALLYMYEHSISQQIGMVQVQGSRVD